MHGENNHNVTMLQPPPLNLHQQLRRDEPAALSQSPEPNASTTLTMTPLQFHHLDPPSPSTMQTRRSAPMTPSRRPSLHPPNDLPPSLETQENVPRPPAMSRSPVTTRICACT